jgi:hypothetical protein
LLDDGRGGEKGGDSLVLTRHICDAESEESSPESFVACRTLRFDDFQGPHFFENLGFFC